MPETSSTGPTKFAKSGPTRRLLWVFTVIVVVLAGYGFSVRFFEFFHTLKDDENGRFTIVPMLNYLAVAAGFICLFGWAMFSGMFRDIEKPKYTMLENEETLDQRVSRLGSR